MVSSAQRDSSSSNFNKVLDGFQRIPRSTCGMDGQRSCIISVMQRSSILAGEEPDHFNVSSSAVCDMQGERTAFVLACLLENQLHETRALCHCQLSHPPRHLYRGEV